MHNKNRLWQKCMAEVYGRSVMQKFAVFEFVNYWVNPKIKRGSVVTVSVPPNSCRTVEDLGFARYGVS
jgi:hypothetical protein